MKILLLEDEFMLSKSIRVFLHSCGHVVDAYDSGKDAIEATLKYSYDFFILAINTPDANGLEVLSATMQKYPDAPKIIISAYNDIDHISKAFRDGCDDYLKKPFNLEELRIRIDKLAKRIPASQNVIHLSQNYAYHKDDGGLYYKGVREKFTRQEHLLVAFLISNIGKPMPQESIAFALWGGEEVENSTIRSLIKRTRAKLKEEILQNIRGFGYMIQRVESATHLQH